LVTYAATLDVPRHTAEFLARHYTPAQLSSKNGVSHAGPQPASIAAEPDAPKQPRGKFIAPAKKTGVPEARSSSSAPGAPATRKSAQSRSRKKV